MTTFRGKGKAIRNFAAVTNTAALMTINKTLVSLTAVIISLTISMSVFIGVVTALTVVLGMIPDTVLYQGLSGMTIVLTIITVFMAFMKLIIMGFSGGNDAFIAASLTKNFVVSLFFVSAALILLSVAVGGFVASVGALGLLAQSGVLGEGMKAMLVFFAMLAAYTLVMRW